MDFQYFPGKPTYCALIWPPCLPLEPSAQGVDAPSEGYDDAEEVPVPGAPAASPMGTREVPPEEESGMRASQTGEWGWLISCHLWSLSRKDECELLNTNPSWRIKIWMTSSAWQHHLHHIPLCNAVRLVGREESLCILGINVFIALSSMFLH